MSNNLGKRLLLERYGQSREEAIEQILRLEDCKKPDESSLGPEEVLVAVRSASVAFIDLLMLSGQYHAMLPLPGVPGLEYAGVVVAAGKAVDPSRVKAGDRVMSD